MGICRCVLFECVFRGEIFTDAGFFLRRVERTSGKFRLRVRAFVDDKRRDFQQVDMGRVLELGSATDYDFRADFDLRRVSDA